MLEESLTAGSDFRITRRRLLGAAGVMVTLPAVPSIARPPVRKRPFLLVHGSWHGGWCWTEVAARLRWVGHEVFTPTLTGLGERGHLISPEISLETHVDDILNVIRFEDLSDVVIVAHSYSGVAVTAVCDRVRDRIAHAIFIDALTPADGQWNAMSLTRDQVAAAFGPIRDGYLIPPPDPSVLGILSSDIASRRLLEARMTPHPLRTWFDPVKIRSGGTDGMPRTFVFCSSAPAGSPIAKLAASRKADRTWRYREIPCGHDAMIIEPQRTAETLLSAV